ncbi:hypothetical protein RRG08_054459 [Elysia crispata]|uniref:Uncharacterized protein n=1 Tax=Elysia crispata TaxID=231223 RepID=A0AAE0Y830_9GAST|nr:hypothetical protein RRG08_054459 [Elysia crispata]
MQEKASIATPLTREESLLCGTVRHQANSHDSTTSPHPHTVRFGHLNGSILGHNNRVISYLRGQQLHVEAVETTSNFSERRQNTRNSSGMLDASWFVFTPRLQH